MRKSVLFASCAAVLAGCAGSGRLGELPATAPGAHAGKLVVLRTSSLYAVASSYYVTLDGREVFVLRSGEHTTFAVPPGPHTVGVRCLGGWLPTWKQVSADFVAV